MVEVGWFGRGLGYLWDVGSGFVFFCFWSLYYRFGIVCLELFVKSFGFIFIVLNEFVFLG